MSPETSIGGEINLRPAEVKKIEDTQNILYERGGKPAEPPDNLYISFYEAQTAYTSLRDQYNLALLNKLDSRILDKIKIQMERAELGYSVAKSKLDARQQAMKEQNKHALYLHSGRTPEAAAEWAALCVEHLTAPEIDFLHTRIDALIEDIQRDGVTCVFFLDKSARPLSALLRYRWQQLRSNLQRPDIKFLNIGRGQTPNTKGWNKQITHDPEDAERIAMLKKYLRSIKGSVYIVDEASVNGSSLRTAQAFLESLTKEEETQPMFMAKSLIIVEDVNFDYYLLQWRRMRADNFGTEFRFPVYDPVRDPNLKNEFSNNLLEIENKVFTDSYSQVIHRLAALEATESDPAK